MTSEKLGLDSGQAETGETAEMVKTAEMLSESICHTVLSHPHSYIYLLQSHPMVITVNN